MHGPRGAAATGFTAGPISLGSLIERFLFAAADHHARTLARKYFGDGAADAAAGPGDQRDLVLEDPRHSTLLQTGQPQGEAEGALRIVGAEHGEFFGFDRPLRMNGQHRLVTAVEARGQFAD